MSPETLKMSRQAYEDREAKVYTAILAAAMAFAEGRKDAAAAAEFGVLFEAHAEPGLKAHYRVLALEFFAWAADSGKK